MEKEQTNLEKAQSNAKEAIYKTNLKIQELIKSKCDLLDTSKIMQNSFEKIRNIPSENKLEVKEIQKKQLNWEKQIKEIKKANSRLYEQKNKKVITESVAGIMVDPTIPIVTSEVSFILGLSAPETFILSNGGALASGIILANLSNILTVGSSILSSQLLTPEPVSLTVASLILFSQQSAKNKKRRLENILYLISEREVLNNKQLVIEIDRLIYEIKCCQDKLNQSIDEILTFGTDYSAMTEKQQYKLGASVNTLVFATQLLDSQLNTYDSLYDEEDLMQYMLASNRNFIKNSKEREAVIYIANLLFQIRIEKKDKKILVDFFKKNQDFLSITGLSSDDIETGIIDKAINAIQYKCDQLGLKYLEE